MTSPEPSWQVSKKEGCVLLTVRDIFKLGWCSLTFQGQCDIFFYWWTQEYEFLSPGTQALGFPAEYFLKQQQCFLSLWLRYLWSQNDIRENIFLFIFCMYFCMYFNKKQKWYGKKNYILDIFPNYWWYDSIWFSNTNYLKSKNTKKMFFFF